MARFPGTTQLFVSSISSFSRLFLVVRCLLIPVCWWQELERRARDKYGAFDQISVELR
jgi:hypothetical protein